MEQSVYIDSITRKKMNKGTKLGQYLSTCTGSPYHNIPSGKSIELRIRSSDSFPGSRIRKLSSGTDDIAGWRANPAPEREVRSAKSSSMLRNDGFLKMDPRAGLYVDVSDSQDGSRGRPCPFSEGSLDGREFVECCLGRGGGERIPPVLLSLSSSYVLSRDLIDTVVPFLRGGGGRAVGVWNKVDVGRSGKESLCKVE